MSDGVQFPQYLSKPYQVLWFEPDDMVVLIVAVYFFGFKVGGWFWLAAPVAPVFYGRIKRNYPRGFFRHLGYFLGVSPFKGYPSYFEQKFLE